MALILLVIVTKLHVPLAQPVTDPFQEGEYTAFGFLLHTQPDFRAPVLIHGGLDVVPSHIAALACRANNQVVCVRTINSFIGLASAALFIAVLATLSGLGTSAALLAGLPAVATLWLYNGPALLAVDGQQGTPGVRDIFVMGGLLCMAVLCRDLDSGKKSDGKLTLIALGCLTGIGLFWAYNRGIVLGLVAGGFTIALCALRRSAQPALLAALAGIAGIAVTLAAGGVALVADTVFNIVYWSQNGSIFHSPIKLIRAAPAFAFSVPVLIGSIWVAWECLRSKKPGRVLMLTALVAVYALYLVQSLNRLDNEHLRWAIWPATLILALIILFWVERTNVAPAHPGGARLLIFLLFAGACIEMYSSASILRVVSNGLQDNVATIFRGATTDRELINEDLVRVADLIAASGRCTFVANNAGIIYLLARKPPCSRFAFGVYVASNRQAEVIAALEAGQPEIIPWDSSAYYSKIDGRSFRDRTPLLAKWIEGHYPIRTVIGEQVVLSRAPLPR